MFDFLSIFEKKDIHHMLKKLLLITALVISGLQIQAQTSFNANGRFEQLESTLPTPNSYRTASGSPGKDYWQQRADYDIKVELDDINRKITGSETITYFNNSPDELPYLWLQLDQNLYDLNSRGQAKMPATGRSRYGDAKSTFSGGYKISSVELLTAGKPAESIPFVITGGAIAGR
jgi:hypothetical protein